MHSCFFFAQTNHNITSRWYMAKSELHFGWIITVIYFIRLWFLRMWLIYCIAYYCLFHSTTCMLMEAVGRHFMLCANCSRLIEKLMRPPAITCGISLKHLSYVLLLINTRQNTVRMCSVSALYLRTPPKTLKPIFSVIISSILSNWLSILWWINSLMAGFKTSPFATTLCKENRRGKKQTHCLTIYFSHCLLLDLSVSL